MRFAAAVAFACKSNESGSPDREYPFDQIVKHLWVLNRPIGRLVQVNRKDDGHTN